MPVAISCPKCSTKYSLPDQLLGKPIKCKSCGTAFRTKAPGAAPQQRAVKQPVRKPAQPQPSQAELSQMGIDGPLKKQPDLFAQPLSRQAPDILGNHAADPGFAEMRYQADFDEDEEDTEDELADIYRNPYMPTQGHGQKQAAKVYEGDPDYSYGGLLVWAILVTVGVSIFFTTFIGTAGFVMYKFSKVDAAVKENEEAYEAAIAAAEAAAEGEDGEYDEEIFEEMMAGIDQEEVASDLVSMLLGALAFVVVGFLTYFTTGIMFLLFMYRANCNVRALGAKGLKISPGGSIGWWFCPFMNATKPVQSMTEIYQASMKPEGKRWKKLPTPTSVGLWWFLFGFWAAPFGIGALIGYDNIGGGLTAKILFWLSVALFLAAGIAMVYICFKVAKKQKEHAYERGLI